MKKIGYPCGRFYEIIATPNKKGQPQQKLRLCSASDTVKNKQGDFISVLYNQCKVANRHIDYYEHPLYGCLLARMEQHSPDTPVIVAINKDDKNDAGVRFWDDVVSAEELESWLEVPLFDRNTKKLCAVMIFDRRGSERIDDDDNKAIANLKTL